MESDLYEHIRQAILLERQKSIARVHVDKPYLLYHVKGIPVYCSGVTCLIHPIPHHWMDSAYVLENHIYVVLFEQLRDTGFVLGEYVHLCLLRKRYWEGERYLG